MTVEELRDEFMDKACPNCAYKQRLKECDVMKPRISFQVEVITCNRYFNWLERKLTQWEMGGEK
jgi:hypothetical protein